MKYKNYLGHAEYDSVAKIFHGEVIGLKDVVTFQGKSVDELEKAFKDSIDDYLAFCKELGRTPEKPFSGKILIRLTPEMHAKAALAAKKNNVSLNSLIVESVSKLIEIQPQKKPLRPSSQRIVASSSKLQKRKKQ